MAAPFLGSLALPFMEYRWPRLTKCQYLWSSGSSLPRRVKWYSPRPQPAGLGGVRPKTPGSQGREMGEVHTGGSATFARLRSLPPPCGAFFWKGGSLRSQGRDCTRDIESSGGFHTGTAVCFPPLGNRR